jgi:hypothetical protein
MAPRMIAAAVSHCMGAKIAACAAGLKPGAVVAGHRLAAQVMGVIQISCPRRGELICV